MLALEYDHLLPSHPHTNTHLPPSLPPCSVNAETGEPPSTAESATSSPIDMAVGEEDSTTPTTTPTGSTHHKMSEATSHSAAESISLYASGGGGGVEGIHDTSGLVTMEMVMPGGEGGEVVGGMAQHNGLPGYSPPRDRQDSEATLDVREPGLMGAEEEDDEEEDT